MPKEKFHIISVRITSKALETIHLKVKKAKISQGEIIRQALELGLPLVTPTPVAK